MLTSHKASIGFGKLFVLALFMATLMFGMAGSTVVKALDCPKDMSSLDCNALYGNWVGWVPEHLSGDTCGGGTGNVSLVGSDNQQKTFNYFKAKGMTDIQAAAIVGNLMQESGINPRVNQHNNGAGRGIGQWTVDDRWQQLLNFATQQNSSPYSLGLQLDFMWKELSGTYKYALKNLQKQSDIFGATGWFMGTSAVKYYDPATTKFINQYGRVSGYENPGRPYLNNRVNFAKTAAQKYGTGGVQAGSGTSQANAMCGGASSVDCKTANGRAKILCEAQAFNGIYYRWGGGHQGYDAFIKGCPDPTQATNNHPHGSPSDPTNGGLSGNPSACAVDCSGLVSMSVDMAFGVKINESTTTERTSGNWKRISPGQATAGDIFQPESGHVEIVDHIVGNTIHAFGAHRTGEKTGPDTKYTVRQSVFYRYVGPGSP